MWFSLCSLSYSLCESSKTPSRNHMSRSRYLFSLSMASSTFMQIMHYIYKVQGISIYYIIAKRQQGTWIGEAIDFPLMNYRFLVKHLNANPRLHATLSQVLLILPFISCLRTTSISFTITSLLDCRSFSGSLSLCY